jgi:hypothetical protein
MALKVNIIITKINYSSCILFLFYAGVQKTTGEAEKNPTSRIKTDQLDFANFASSCQ